MRLLPSRIFSVLPLFVLSSLSLLVCLVHGLTHEQPDAVARHARQLSGKRSIFARQGGGGLLGGSDDDEDAAPSSSSASAGSSSSPVASPSSSTTRESSTSTSSRSTTSSSSTSSSFSTSSSVTPSSTSSESSSSTSSTSSSTSFSSTSTSISSTSQTSSSSTTSSSRTTLQVTSLPTSTSTSVVVATPTLVRSISSSATSSVVETSAAATSSETGSSSSFLSNTGAVAGTFTAVGVVAVGGICAAVLFIRKRKRNEELDIFDTEYRDYSTGNDLGGFSGNADYFASDMTALSSNAVTNAGSHTGHAANSGYGHVDFGYGAPAPADRDSVASNHAGYGAFRAATEQRKPPMQGSGLRNEAAWSSDAAYAEPAVDENQSIHVTPSNEDAYYAAAVRVPGSAY